MLPTPRSFNLEHILRKAINRRYLSTAEIIFLLSLSDQLDCNRLFETARFLRNRYFGDNIFLYGFIYFSTWCRNDCNFCYYRKSNQLSNRYRKTEQEIVDAAHGLAETGVHLIDLTMGEDPFYFENQQGFKSLLDLVGQIKKITGLPVMVSPGVASRQTLAEFAGAGVDWYACYQETHNTELFKGLRHGQNYTQRLMSKMWATQSGLLVEEGILTGVGESLEDIAISLNMMRSLGAHQVRVMTFVPQEGIPLAAELFPSRSSELLIIAVLRLLFPDRLIPASLDIDGIDGLQARMNAGANVVTSLIPPQSGLAGVAQSTKDINEGYRTVQGVLPVLERMGLKVATREYYLDWVDREQHKLQVPVKTQRGG